MSEREPPVGIDPAHDSDDPREERLQALYSAAYLALDPSEALEQRVAQITAHPGMDRARPPWLPWALGRPSERPALQATLSLGAAGAGSFVVTVVAAVLLSSAPAREPRPLAAGSAAARRRALEYQARQSVWLTDPAPSVLPFPLAPPPEEEVPPKPPRPLPVRRSERRGSASTT